MDIIKIHDRLENELNEFKELEKTKPKNDKQRYTLGIIIYIYKNLLYHIKQLILTSK